MTIEISKGLQARIAELDIESHEDEFQYWRKFDQKNRK